MAIEPITTGARLLARRVVDMVVRIHKKMGGIARRYADIACASVAGVDILPYSRQCRI
jgi:hypothetical protein